MRELAITSLAGDGEAESTTPCQWRRTCPKCGAPLRRTHRTAFERWIKPVRRLHRYACPNEACGWQGALQLQKRRRVFSRRFLGMTWWQWLIVLALSGVLGLGLSEVFVNPPEFLHRPAEVGEGQGGER